MSNSLSDRRMSRGNGPVYDAVLLTGGVITLIMFPETHPQSNSIPLYSCVDPDPALWSAEKTSRVRP